MSGKQFISDHMAKWRNSTVMPVIVRLRGEKKHILRLWSWFVHLIIKWKWTAQRTTYSPSTKQIWTFIFTVKSELRAEGKLWRESRVYACHNPVLSEPHLSMRSHVPSTSMLLRMRLSLFVIVWFFYHEILFDFHFVCALLGMFNVKKHF